MRETNDDPGPEATAVAVDDLGDFDPLDAVDVSDPPPGTTARGGEILEDLADVLRRAGLRVREVDGWQQRQRGGSGYSQSGPIGIIVHHTASSSGWDGQQDANFLTFQCDVKPMANLYLDRGGQWWVLAGGATNTNGAGGPWGPIPVDSANSRVIGIEAGNNGVGEPWPDVMQDAYVAGVAALADGYRIEPGNVLSHQEWAPTRKVDPAGPSRFGSINSSHTWDMDRFRAAVNKARGGPGPIKITPEKPKPSKTNGKTYVVKPGDSWWKITERTMGDPSHNWRKLADANGGPDRQLHPGQVLTIPGRKKPSPAAGDVPPFPGEAKLDDRGPVVLAWQHALIAHGVISDRPANRDSHYGRGMMKAVMRLQKSWEWSDADGVAGKHTWSKLHGGD
jgi:N-acetylmuramoyl-L-alanine amidase/LysM domain